MPLEFMHWILAPITCRVDKNKILKDDACMGNTSIKCRSLTRRNKKNKDGETHASHTQHADKNNNCINNRK